MRIIIGKSAVLKSGSQAGAPRILAPSSPIAFDQCRWFHRQTAVQTLHRQRQTRAHMVFNRGQVACFELLPDAGRHVTTDDTVVQHGNAGATDHGV